MDLKIYYQKIREVEARIEEQFPIVISKETADGGHAGTATEVPRRLAAKMIVEGLARIALTTGDRETAKERLAQAAQIRDQFYRPAPPHERRDVEDVTHAP